MYPSQNIGASTSSSLLTNPTWIAINKQGILLPEQVDLLARHVHSVSRGCAICGFLGVVLFIIIIPFNTTMVSPFSVLIGVLFISLCIFVPLYVRAKREHFKREVASGLRMLQVQREQGEIVWGGNTYVARTPRSLLTIPGNRDSLPPGPYHFAYVENWQMMNRPMTYEMKNRFFIVSAQAIHTNTGMLSLPGTLAATGLTGDKQARLAIQQALCATLKFSIADLETNQRGVISQEQVVKFPRKLLQDPYLSVQSIEGEVKPRKVKGDENSSDKYYYDIGNLSFRLPGRGAHDALVKGIQYRVYYAVYGKKQRSKQILSIEPLEAPR